jgi:hypothetical protein
MKRKLTTEEIEFIQNYLKNSGVEYIDTRAELVDHVASEIEDRLEVRQTSNFYNEFKAYMLQHKKSLLKNIHKYRWALDKRILKQVVINLLHKNVIAIFALLVLLGLVLIKATHISVEDLKLSYVIVTAGVIFLSVVYPIFWFRKHKISVINRAAILCYLMNYLLFQYIEKLVDENFIYYSAFILVITWVNVSFAFTQLKYFNFYRNKFQLS